VYTAFTPESGAYAAAPHEPHHHDH
jgi:hypothetical protein